MIRLSIIHEFLCYLLRDYKGTGPSNEEKFDPGDSELPQIAPILVRVPDSEPHVYLDEMSWKRFLPPLPAYKGKIQIQKLWSICDHTHSTYLKD